MYIIYYFLLLHTLHIYIYLYVCVYFSEVSLPTLKVSASSDEDKEVTFSCFAKDFSPNYYKFKWMADGQDISDKIYEFKTHSEKRNTEHGTLYSAASLLTVKTTHLTVGTEITCLFEGRGENGATHVNSSVIYKGPCVSEYISTFSLKIVCKFNFDSHAVSADAIRNNCSSIPQMDVNQIWTLRSLSPLWKTCL